MTNTQAAITGIHAYVPDYVLTNAELEKAVETNDEWIVSRTGIRERRILKGEGLATSYLGIQAVQGLLEKTGTKPEDVERLSKSLPEGLFSETSEGRIWIVAGYSGEQDPVFQHLAAVPQFDERLYWIGYGEEDPKPHVLDLIQKQKYAFYVKGHDADSFFYKLSYGLDCFPPRFISQPFTHLKELVSTLSDFKLSGEDGFVDILQSAKKLIDEGIQQLERGPQKEALRLDAKVAQSAAGAPEDAETQAWSLILQGNTLLA